MRWGVALAMAAGGWAAAVSAAPDGIERGVLDEINRARTQPSAVAADLRRYRATIEGRVAYEDGDPVGMMTAEGRGAVDEAIDFLERQAPMPPLDAGSVLTRAAQGWARAQGRTGATGHASPGERVRAAGGDVFVGETISYGMASARAVVRQLIVDDGQRGRGHRALVFARDFRFAGVGCGAHARFGTMCVIDYAGTPDGAPAMTQVAALQPSRASAFSR